MIRASLSASAAQGFSLVSAAAGTAFQRRTAGGGISTGTAGPNLTAPRWVRIARIGTKVSAFTSSDGQKWTLIGTDTIALGATAYVGLATTSHTAKALTTATLSQVVVRPLGVPAPQLAADMGARAIPGTGAFSGGTYTINAAGLDIWNTADQFHF